MHPDGLHQESKYNPGIVPGVHLESIRTSQGSSHGASCWTLGILLMESRWSSSGSILFQDSWSSPAKPEQDSANSPDGLHQSQFNLMWCKNNIWLFADLNTRPFAVTIKYMLN